GLRGESYAALTSDGAWCWFGDPRAVFHEGEHRRTYAGFVTSSGDLALAQFDHDSREVTSAVVKEQLQQDDRASPAVVVRPDHRLMVFYSGHRGRWMIYRISANAEDVTSWGEPHAASGHTSEFSGHTYPNAVLLAGENGRRYVFWRGAKSLPMFAFSETGLSWSEPDVLIRGDGERPSVKMASDGGSTIHFAFTNGHPGDEPANSIYYVCYRNGVFRRADGSSVGTMEDLPLAFEDADLVYDAAGAGARACLWDVAFDPSGNPVIAYAVFPSVEDHRYRYARWGGAAWVDTEIAPAGAWFPTVEKGRRHFAPYYSGGMALDHSDPSIVYLSRPVDGVFEIERWTTRDDGRSWTSEAVTSGSVSNNVRPLVPLGHASDGPGLIWMNGTYVDYANYSTSLRMK
ncbi:MAG: BNR-4 repeat-containing protein, partial [Candidatus Eisenbacteria sp.]|nr:BNR-4 repeat-containing protein [Candidatus Eisenbacteria bacterium]